MGINLPPNQSVANEPSDHPEVQDEESVPAGITGASQARQASGYAKAGAYEDAARYFEIALGMDPGLQAVRIQYGLLLMTLARPLDALAVLSPLQLLPADHCLRLYAEGLSALARDDLTAAAQALHQGLSLEPNFPALQKDLVLIVDALNTAVALRGPLQPAPNSQSIDPVQAEALIAVYQKFAA